MDKVTLNGGKVVLKNFSGAEIQYADFIVNPEGRRTFGVLIGPVIAERLIEIGWFPRPLMNEAGSVEEYYLPVTLSFAHPHRPFVCILREADGKKLDTSLLGEDDVHILDELTIKHVDVTVAPVPWATKTRSGARAFCYVLYVYVDESDEEE